MASAIIMSEYRPATSGSVCMTLYIVESRDPVCSSHSTV